MVRSHSLETDLEKRINEKTILRKFFQVTEILKGYLGYLGGVVILSSTEEKKDMSC